MRYTVESYEPSQNCHKCDCHDGTKRLVDLMVNGDFPQGTTPESLVGKTFDADYEHPYITIAMNVREAAHIGESSHERSADANA